MHGLVFGFVDGKIYFVGTEVSLVPVEGWDDLDEEDRRRLHEALLASEDDITHGRVYTAEEVLNGLRGA